MALDLNADVGKIIKDFLSGKKADPRTKRGKKKLDENYKHAILKSILILCITTTICYVIHLYSQSPIARTKSEFVDSAQLRDALTTIEANINSAKAMLVNNKHAVSDIIGFFSDQQGSKNLFRTISTVASANSISLKNITKGNTEQISTPAPHEKTIVLLELEGAYVDYISFKEELLKQKPYLTINLEKVAVVQGSNGERRLSISLELLDFAVNKKTYEDLLAKNI